MPLLQGTLHSIITYARDHGLDDNASISLLYAHRDRFLEEYPPPQRPPSYVLVFCEPAPMRAVFSAVKKEIFGGIGLSLNYSYSETIVLIPRDQTQLGGEENDVEEEARRVLTDVAKIFALITTRERDECSLAPILDFVEVKDGTPTVRVKEWFRIARHKSLTNVAWIVLPAGEDDVGGIAVSSSSTGTSSFRSSQQQQQQQNSPLVNRPPRTVDPQSHFAAKRRVARLYRIVLRTLTTSSAEIAGSNVNPENSAPSTTGASSTMMLPKWSSYLKKLYEMQIMAHWSVCPQRELVRHAQVVKSMTKFLLRQEHGRPELARLAGELASSTVLELYLPNRMMFSSSTNLRDTVVVLVNFLQRSAQKEFFRALLTPCPTVTLPNGEPAAHPPVPPRILRHPRHHHHHSPHQNRHPQRKVEDEEEDASTTTSATEEEEVEEEEQVEEKTTGGDKGLRTHHSIKRRRGDTSSGVSPEDVRARHLTRALDLAQRALECNNRLLGRQSLPALRSLLQVGNIYRVAGDNLHAEECFVELLRYQEPHVRASLAFLECARTGTVAAEEPGGGGHASSRAHEVDVNNMLHETLSNLVLVCSSCPPDSPQHPEQTAKAEHFSRLQIELLRSALVKGIKRAVLEEKVALLATLGSALHHRPPPIARRAARHQATGGGEENAATTTLLGRVMMRNFRGEESARFASQPTRVLMETLREVGALNLHLAHKYEAAATLARAFEIRKTLPGGGFVGQMDPREREEAVRDLDALARLHLQCEDFNGAAELYRWAAALFEREIAPPVSPQLLATTHYNLARALHMNCAVREAAVHYQRALEIFTTPELMPGFVQAMYGFYQQLLRYLAVALWECFRVLGGGVEGDEGPEGEYSTSRRRDGREEAYAEGYDNMREAEEEEEEGEVLDMSRERATLISNYLARARAYALRVVDSWFTPECLAATEAWSRDPEAVRQRKRQRDSDVLFKCRLILECSPEEAARRRAGRWIEGRKNRLQARDEERQARVEAFLKHAEERVRKHPMYDGDGIEKEANAARGLAAALSGNRPRAQTLLAEAILQFFFDPGAGPTDRINEIRGSFFIYRFLIPSLLGSRSSPSNSSPPPPREELAWIESAARTSFEWIRDARRDEGVSILDVCDAGYKLGSLLVWFTAASVAPESRGNPPAPFAHDHHRRRLVEDARRAWVYCLETCEPYLESDHHLVRKSLAKLAEWHGRKYDYHHEAHVSSSSASSASAAASAREEDRGYSPPQQQQQQQQPQYHHHPGEKRGEDTKASLQLKRQRSGADRLRTPTEGEKERGNPINRGGDVSAAGGVNNDENEDAQDEEVDDDQATGGSSKHENGGGRPPLDPNHSPTYHHHHHHHHDHLGGDNNNNNNMIHLGGGSYGGAVASSQDLTSVHSRADEGSQRHQVELARRHSVDSITTAEGTMVGTRWSRLGGGDRGRKEGHQGTTTRRPKESDDAHDGAGETTRGTTAGEGRGDDQEEDNDDHSDDSDAHSLVASVSSLAEDEGRRVSSSRFRPIPENVARSSPPPSRGSTGGGSTNAAAGHRSSDSAKSAVPLEGSSGKGSEDHVSPPGATTTTTTISNRLSNRLAVLTTALRPNLAPSFSSGGSGMSPPGTPVSSARVVGRNLTPASSVSSLLGAPSTGNVKTGDAAVSQTKTERVSPPPRKKLGTDSSNSSSLRESPLPHGNELSSSRRPQPSTSTGASEVGTTRGGERLANDETRRTTTTRASETRRERWTIRSLLRIFGCGTV